jgi:hypothetical protein
MSRPIPNRWVPLTPDERLAQQYAHQPGRLLELAAATGNRALHAIALDMVRKEPRPRR